MGVAGCDAVEVDRRDGVVATQELGELEGAVEGRGASPADGLGASEARARFIQGRGQRGLEAADVLEVVKEGERLTVVGEHGGQGNQPGWLEVRTGRGRTAYVRPTRVGYPQARPNEAVSLIGRQAVVTGRVQATRVTSKVIQLKFEDEMRPPFVAVLFKQAAGPFEQAGINPAEAFQGRRVRVKGRVSAWKMPEIVIRGPDMIEVVAEGRGRAASLQEPSRRGQSNNRPR